MRILKWLYKRMLRKLSLSRDQLRDLKEQLVVTNICSGPFIRGNKMCPNTTALAIKRGMHRFQTNEEVKELLRRYRISNVELWIFYTLFDLPARASRTFFEKALGALRAAIEELLYEIRKYREI